MEIVKCQICCLNVIPRATGVCPGCGGQLCQPQSETPERCDEKSDIRSTQEVKCEIETSVPNPESIQLCTHCHQDVLVSDDGTCSFCTRVVDSARAIEHVLQWKPDGERSSPEPNWALLERTQRQNRRSGWIRFFTASIIATITLVLVAFAVTLAWLTGQSAYDGPDARMARPVIAAFGAFIVGPLLYIVSKLINEGRRAMQRDARLVLRDDRRPPVIYLRSFMHDASRQDPTRNVRTTAGLSLAVYSPPTQELHLTRVFRRVGPVVAIGRPGEDLPELGAHRLYVENGWWKSEVLRLVQSARVVVIRIGPTLGTYWEFLNVFRCVPRERIVLYLEPRGVLPPALRPYLPEETQYADHSPARFLWFPTEGGTRLSDNPLEVVEGNALGKRRLFDVLFPSPCESPAEQTLRDWACWAVVAVVGGVILFIVLSRT